MLADLNPLPLWLGCFEFEIDGHSRCRPKAPNDRPLWYLGSTFDDYGVAPSWYDAPR